MKLAPSEPAPSYVFPQEVLRDSPEKQLKGTPESIVREDRRHDYSCAILIKRDDAPPEPGKRCLDVAVAHDEMARTKEQQLFEALAAAPEQCTPGERERIADLRREAKAHRRDAMTAFVRSGRQHRDYRGTDVAHALLAWELERVADMAEAFRENGVEKARDEAHRIRTRLTEHHPDSPWLPRALADEAEALFRDGREQRALELYSRALESPALDGHLEAFLFYRSAWCALRENRAGDANNFFDSADAAAGRHAQESWSAPLRAAIARERPTR